MFWLVILLSPLAKAVVFPVGHNPEGFYLDGHGPQSGLSVETAYPRYYQQPEVYNHQVAADRSQYRDGQGYRSLGRDARGNEIIRDSGGLTSRDSDVVIGGQMIARDNERAGGHQRGASGAIYNQAGNAATGAAEKYGAAGLGAYGDFGAAGHDKGHSTTGFHKSYHNIASGKNTKFIDEDNDEANRKFGQAQEAAYGNQGFGVRGQGHDEGLHAERISQDAAARGSVVAQGVQQAKYGAHDMNGYYHNQDLAYKRGQALAEENQLSRQGLQGLRVNNRGILRFGELW